MDDANPAQHSVDLDKDDEAETQPTRTKHQIKKHLAIPFIIEWIRWRFQLLQCEWNNLSEQEHYK